MKKFIETHKKLLSKLLGIFLIIVAAASMYWTTPKKSYSTSSKSTKSSSLKAISVMGSSSASKRKSSSQNIQEVIKARQDKQVKLFLILMIVGGVIFVAYGFFKKDEK